MGEKGLFLIKVEIYVEIQEFALSCYVNRALGPFNYLSLMKIWLWGQNKLPAMRWKVCLKLSHQLSWLLLLLSIRLWIGILMNDEFAGSCLCSLHRLNCRRSPGPGCSR